MRPRSAHNAVYIARKDGAIEPRPCEECGATPACAHHDDYNKPLEVRWLCPKHHMGHHAKLRRESGVTHWRTIQDEFTQLPISQWRRYQLRRDKRRGIVRRPRELHDEFSALPVTRWRKYRLRRDKRLGIVRRKPVQDHFSCLPVTRERKRQLRQLEKGLCIRCQLPLVTSNYCLKHAVEVRERQRAARKCKRRNANAKTYRLEKAA